MSAEGMPVPGTVLDGKYRLVRQLGAGGMGIVYEADHIRLRQPFAIKILQPEFAKEKEFLLRFEREARAAALLRSPHVVRVFDVDVSSEGLTYMVMELLEGRDLAEEALENPPSVAQLVDWVVQTCAGLQEAHDNGIVHRDLKPPNIFLTRIESGERIAKVLDFGISKLEATSTFHLTNKAQGALGTPTYMAPEQIRNRHVDGRTDIWALGVMIYRLLAGRWPFSGKGDQGYMAAVLADPPLPFEVLRPDLPYELATVIMKAIEKDVADRHQSANELAAALLPFGSGRAALPTRASLPAAAMAAATPAQVTVPPIPQYRPLAIVMPSGTPAGIDRSGVLDTIVDGTRSDFVRGHGGTPHGVASPTATAFVPQTTRAPKNSGATMIVAAACLAAGVGFGAYMLATASKRSAAATTTAPPQPAQSTKVASEPLPPPAVELPPGTASAEASPASTGVPSVPSASSTPAAPAASAAAAVSGTHHRPPRRGPTAPGAPALPSAAPPPAAPIIPDHL